MAFVSIYADQLLLCAGGKFGSAFWLLMQGPERSGEGKTRERQID